MSRLDLRLPWGIVFLAWLWAAPPALAQGGSALDTLTVELWPEFDRPSALVILSGTLAAQAPTEVTLAIPAASGGPHAVAVVDAAGNLINTQYTTANQGNNILLTIQLDRPNFHVEYYDPALAIEGDRRDYLFQWQPPGSVGNAALRVQEPFGATDLSAEPALTPSGAGEFGLTYYGAALGSLQAGQAISLRLTYSKSSPALSSDSVGAGVPVAVDPVEPAALELDSTTLIWAGAAAGVLAILIGAFFYVKRAGDAREQKPAAGRRRHRGRRTASVEPGTMDSAAGYCTQCGHPRSVGDRFCRNCGAALRT
jgi:hypothetical protein